MDSNQLLQSHQASWQALTQLLNRAEKNVRSLSPAEIEQLGQLYRVASSDLALALRDFPRHKLTAYLNQLVARGHAVLYRSEPLAGKRLRNFVTTDFPRAFRNILPFFVTATLLFWLPVFIALFAVVAQPDNARWVLDDGGQSLLPTLESGKLWTEIPVAERPFASSFIMRNNIQVAILAFGGGLLAGIFTVYVTVMNGLMLGGALGLTIHYNLGFNLLTFVIGHGVIELSVIVIAGAAGLTLGWAILRPGLLSRGDALKSAARQAVVLITGCVPLLIIAGTIEGFISPADNIPWPVKWLLGILTGIALYSYLFLAGRESPTRHYQFAQITTPSGPSGPDSD